MAKPISNQDDDFAYWEERYGEPLNEARRVAISRNLSDFFSTLYEIAEAEKAKEGQTLESQCT